MAIAPLGEGPRRGSAQPALRLVRGGRVVGGPVRGPGRHVRIERSAPQVVDRPELERSRAEHPTSRRAMVVPSRPEPAAQRTAAARRSAAVARRRAATLAAIAVVAVVLLALPLRSLAAVTVDGQVTPTASPGGLAPGSVYVVHAGDTLRSIARRVVGANVAAVEGQLAVEVGSSVLVPGEHVHIP
jgi:LysM repeat protein